MIIQKSELPETLTPRLTRPHFQLGLGCQRHRLGRHSLPADRLVEEIRRLPVGVLVISWSGGSELTRPETKPAVLPWPSAPLLPLSQTVI